MSAIDDEIKQLLEGLKMESLLKIGDVKENIPESNTNNIAIEPVEEHLPEQSKPQAPPAHKRPYAIVIGGGIVAAAIIAISGWYFFQQASETSQSSRIAIVDHHKHPGFDQQMATLSKKISIGSKKGLVAFATPAVQFNESSLPRDAQEALTSFLVQLRLLLDNRQNVLERKSDDIDDALQGRIHMQVQQNSLNSQLRRFQAADILLSYRIAQFIQGAQENLVKEYAIPHEMVISELLRMNALDFKKDIIEQVQAINSTMLGLKQTILLVRKANNLSNIADELLAGYQQIKMLEANSVAACLVDIENQQLRLQKACQEALDKILQEHSSSHYLRLSSEDMGAFDLLSTMVPGPAIDRWKNWIAVCEESGGVRSDITDQSCDFGFFICESNPCVKATLIENVDQLAINRSQDV